TEQRKLQLHHEIFEQPGIDELGVFRAGDPDVGPSEHVVDLAGEEEASHSSDGKRGKRLDEPRAQLDKMIHQGRLGGLDLLFFVFASHRTLSAPSGEETSAVASTGAMPAPETSAAASPIGNSLLPGAAGLSGGLPASFPLSLTVSVFASGLVAWFAIWPGSLLVTLFRLVSRSLPIAST